MAALSIGTPSHSRHSLKPTSHRVASTRNIDKAIMIGAQPKR